MSCHLFCFLFLLALVAVTRPCCCWEAIPPRIVVLHRAQNCFSIDYRGTGNNWSKQLVRKSGRLKYWEGLRVNPRSPSKNLSNVCLKSECLRRGGVSVVIINVSKKGSAGLWPWNSLNVPFLNLYSSSTGTMYLYTLRILLTGGSETWFDLRDFSSLFYMTLYIFTDVPSFGFLTIFEWSVFAEMCSICFRN